MSGSPASGTAATLDATTQALWSVCAASVTALRTAARDYQAGGTPAALSRLANEADVASSALARLGKRLASLPRSHIRRATPAAVSPDLDIGRVHAWAANAMTAVRQGQCDHCGGILASAMPQSSSRNSDLANPFDHEPPFKTHGLFQ